MDILYKNTGDRLKLNSANCKIIAHAGLYTDGVVQNTIEAYRKAIDTGFEWLEIDTRKTNDGVYVMAHNDALTLYNNGSAVSVTISTSSFDTICGLTWDAAGIYKICTLESVFRTFRLEKAGFIIDLKSGSNVDIVEIAARCGVLDRIMLSYNSFLSAYNERDLLNQYPYVIVRIYPNDYLNVPQYLENVKNPTFAAPNVVGVDNYTITTPLAYNMPFIFAGCSMSNIDRWLPLAAGCMFGDSIPLKRIEQVLDVDFNVPAKITISSADESIAVSQVKTIEASSNVSSIGGYVYGFVKNPSIASCKQKTFGQNAAFEVAGRMQGETILKVFTCSGAVKQIAITVT